MSGLPAERELDAYLARLDGALGSLSAQERQDILLETRSHVLERSQRDATEVSAVLSELGAAEVYARQFLGDASEEQPLRASTLTRFARLATGGWTSLPLLLFVVSGYAIAVFALFMAVAKLVEPDGTGFYTGGGSSGLWLSNPDAPGRDVLGYWLVPVALAVAAVIHVLLSRLLKRL